ncbi:MAG: sulfatase-like hydrolase/transferase [Phycisphaerae bacterium]|nr:sulfatase-like hydrolase/transferase [Phycisphaerae bacterium]
MKRRPTQANDVTSRRDFLKKCAAFGTGAFLLSNNSLEVAVAAKRPNIILIMADDQGYECLSCYDSASYKTPVLDELAGTGMRFEHCYSQPLCTPTRVQIMTGRYNFRNYVKFGHFDYTERTFAHVLKAAGYATCAVGKWQLIGDPGANAPFAAGFDEYCLWHMEDVFGPKDSRYRNPKIIQNAKLLGILDGKYGPDVVTDYVNGFIERNKSGPFLVYYPMILTHSPFEPTPASPEWGQSISNKRFYKDMVEYMDKTIGRIVQKLDELGLRENTLILFTGDNGTPKGITSQMADGGSIDGGKGSTTDAGTHVALVANWKGTIPAGKVCGDLIDFSDILPTLADAGAASPPKDVTIDGRSFLPQLRGKKGNPRDWVFCWYQRNPGDQLHRFARDKRWKLYDQTGAERSGKLFDVSADRLEENPVEPGQGGDEADRARAKLQAVLDSMT